MSIADIMGLLPQYIKPGDLPRASYFLHFALTAPEPGDYFLRLGQGRAEFLAAPASGQKPDCRIACSSELLLQIIKGEKDPKMAYLAGKLKISSLTVMLQVAPLLLSLYERHKKAGGKI